jgi:hypothetical protein
MVHPALQECDALATRRNEFGDLFVEFWPTDDRPVAVSGSKQLSADVRHCAASALKGLAREIKPHPGEVAETHGIAPIGRVRPLLPSWTDLLPAWPQAAARGGAGTARARQNLRRLLPPDVVVDRFVPLRDGTGSIALDWAARVPILRASSAAYGRGSKTRTPAGEQSWQLVR